MADLNRPTTAVFKTQEMSVDRASLTTREKSLADHPDDGLAELPARLPRSLTLKVFPDPFLENPAHAIVCPKATDGQAKKMLEGSKISKAPKT
jgi:hypothetical protein